jgi:hypothetical protein
MLIDTQLLMSTHAHSCFAFTPFLPVSSVLDAGESREMQGKAAQFLRTK